MGLHAKSTTPKEPQPWTGNVVFDNVYPLYGAIDIRNSSIERSYAIQKDLKAHFNLVDETLDELQLQVQLPLLEGLKFKNLNFRQSIDKGLPAEEEVRINDFLKMKSPRFSITCKKAMLRPGYDSKVF